MSDDSPSQDKPASRPTAGGGDGPPPFEPDKTVVRPREPQPPSGAIDDGDDTPEVTPGATPDAAGDPGDRGETQPIRADGPPPPPPMMTPADAPDTELAQPAPPASPTTTMVPTAPDGTPAEGYDGTPPGHAGGPVRPEFPMRASRAGLTGAVVAIGTGLLAAAIVIACFNARDENGDIDWSHYAVALGASAGLLLIAVLGAVSSRRAGGRAREEVVTWPGVVGSLGAALCIGIGIDKDDDWVAYLIGAVLVVLGALGYLAARRAAFVLLAILGLALVYGVALDGVVSDAVGDGHPQVVMAVLVALFVVVVTLLGWALPTRAVTGVVVGGFGLAVFVGIMASFVVTRFLGGLFGGFLGGFGDLPGTSDQTGGAGGIDDTEGLGGFGEADLFGQAGFQESDVWWVVALFALLIVLWALAAALSNHSGFSILAIAAAGVLVPLTAAALAVERPSVWAAVLAATGGVVLIGAALLARVRGRRTASELTAEPTV